MKPNFFIVGTPKAGTTSLYHYLEQHPQIFMSPVKETNYFSYDEIKAQNLFYNEEHICNEDQYKALFREATIEKAIGEASVSYLFYPTVPQKIYRYNPEAKIIIVLRNPVDRGFSHYLMDKRLGFVNIGYEDIIRNQHLKDYKLYFQQYVLLGLYYEQVKRYIDIFGTSNVKILLYEDIVKQMENVVKEIYAFLNVDVDFNPDIATKHNVYSKPKNALIQNLYKHKRVRSFAKFFFGTTLRTNIRNHFFTRENKPVINENLKSALLKIYSDDILRTGELIGKSLESWTR
jgi:hypothetical protein